MTSVSAPEMEARLEGLSFLASGLIGRSIAVRLEPALPAPSWTDGLSIMLRDLNGADAPLAVLIQAALIRAGSLDRDLMSRLIGRPELARRYLAVEAPRAVTALADRLPRRLLAHPSITMAGPASMSSLASLSLAQGSVFIPPPAAIFGMLRPGAVIRNTPAIRALSAAGSEADGPLKRNEPALDDDEPAQQSKILKVFSNIAAGGPLADLFKMIAGVSSQVGTDETDATGAGEDLSEAAGRRRTGATGSNAARREPRVAPSHDGLSTSKAYPEWDQNRGLYRPGWTQVHDLAPWNPDDVVDVSPAIHPPTREIRRQIARLGLGFDRHRHQTVGDEIVMDDLVSFVVDTRSGHPGDPRIYRALLKTRRDLGVLILLDASSSVRDSTPDGQSLQMLQLDLAWQLAGALEAAGDRLAIFGFNSWGRNRVHLLRAKGFNERIGSAVVDRLGQMAPAGFTRMGAAVRHAGHVLKAESGMPFNLVVLITDGLSYDDGYEGGYAEADTRRAISELQADHVACLCLSIGGDADAEKLKRVFGEAAFLQTAQVAEVIWRVGPLFNQALASIYAR